MKSIKFQLNTAQSGESIYESKKILGCIKSIYYNIEGALHLKIFLKEYKDVILYEKVDCKGIAYIPLRTEAISNKHEKLNFGVEEYYINDVIIFEIKGAKNTKINIEVLYE